MGDDGIGHAGFADMGRQRARVDAADRHDAALLQPFVEMRGRAVAGGIGDLGAEDGTDGARARGGIEVFHVLVIGADIADMREGEGDDLRRIGRIGQDLLITRQRRVEADLAHRLSSRAEAPSLDDGAVGKDEHGSRGCGGPGGCLGGH
jgi:hypothetical protein